MKGIVDRSSPMTFWGRYRYFIAREYRVGGEAINLYDLERRILPNWTGMPCEDGPNSIWA